MSTDIIKWTLQNGTVIAARKRSIAPCNKTGTKAVPFRYFSFLCKKFSIDMLTSMPTFVQVIEFVGTFAFAISGIRLASAKQFDWFGAYVVGLATAIGGGTIRDLLLDVTPFWMTNSIYMVCSALALLWVILFGKYLIHLNNTFFYFDSIGLALFTVVGIDKTLDAGFPMWVAIIMGTMTGAAGGVIRDVFINEIPLIFRKEIYAMACVAGGLAYCLCMQFDMSDTLIQIITGASVFIIRILSVKYKICLPTLKGNNV